MVTASGARIVSEKPEDLEKKKLRPQQPGEPANVDLDPIKLMSSAYTTERFQKELLKAAVNDEFTIDEKGREQLITPREAEELEESFGKGFAKMSEAAEALRERALADPEGSMAQLNERTQKILDAIERGDRDTLLKLQAEVNNDTDAAHNWLKELSNRTKIVQKNQGMVGGSGSDPDPKQSSSSTPQAEA